MLDWVFDGLIGWTESNIVNKLLDAFSSLLLDSLGVDMTVMMSYFPFLETTFQVIRYIAWSLLFLIIVWQLFRSFGGPIVEAEHPMTLLARGSLAAFLIGYSREVFDILIRIATEPYNALLSAPTAAVSFTNIYEFLKTELQKAAYGIALSSTGFSLLIIILVIAIAWNYFKLALEVVERYVMMGVLYFTAPLGFAMFGSKSTANVFKAWCRMVGSEFFLLIMNVWFIRGFNSAVSAMLITGGNIAGKTGTGILLCLFCILAFLKIAQRFDSYLSTLGLNTAQTGGQLGMEMLMATRLVAGVAGTKGGMSVGSVFRPGAQSPAGNAATGTGAASNGFAAKIKGAFSAETYKRNAISVGKQQGVGGINGFALNTLAAQKLKYGSEVNASTISQITSGQLVPKNNVFSGKSADNSIGNYLPALKDKKLNGTVVEAGHIQSEIISQNGQQTHFEAFSASVFEKPEGVFTTIAASDGSHWYVPADNIPSEGLGEKISFTGNVGEKDAVADMFPQSDITSLRTVESGVMEATYSDGTTGMLISASEFDVPEGMSGTVTDSAGNEWYEMGKSADTTMLNGIDNEPYTSMHGENNEPPVNDVMERNNTPPAGEAYTFTGSAAESEKLHELFPDIPQGATGLSIDTGVMEITSPTGEVSDIYRTDMFENSDAMLLRKSLVRSICATP